MNCQDLEVFLTDYLEGELPAEQVAELEAHIAACPACRAELEAYQQVDQRLGQYFKLQLEPALHSTAKPAAQPGAHPHSSGAEIQPGPGAARHRLPRWVGWAAAALFIIGVGAALWPLYQRAIPRGHDVLAQVQTADGTVQWLDGNQYHPLAAGAELRQAQRVKVAPGGYLALKLRDGNVVEAKGGTQLTLSQFTDRLEVGHNRGSVWAHLNTKPKLPFIIRTAHLTARATGTVYGVEEGLGGSVVSVARGTVQVDAGPAETNVTQGESYCSREGAGQVAASTDWSRLPQDLASLTTNGATDGRPQLETETWPATVATAAAPASGMTTNTATAATAAAAATTPAAPVVSDLAELLPPNAGYFIDVHDWSGILDEFRKSDYSALANEPGLRAWWDNIHGQAVLDEWVKDLHLLEALDIARQIDGQALLAVVPPKGDFLLVADCGRNEAAINAKVEQLLQQAATPASPPADPIGVMSGAAAPTPAATPAAQPGAPDVNKYLDLHGHVQLARGRLIISSDKQLVQDTAQRIASGTGTGYTAGDFYKKIANSVDHPRFVMAADLAGAIDRGLNGKDPVDAETRRVLDFTGVTGLDYLLLSPSFKGSGMNQAARIGFTRERSGLAGWLGEPGPMRGFEFFSSDVHFFASLLTRAPRQMFFDWLVYLNGSGRQADHDAAKAFFERNQALIDALGREVSVGVDNPLLPIPNVKLAVEVIDRPAAETGLYQLVGDLMAKLDTQGKYSYREATPYKTYTIQTLKIDGVPLTPAYAFADDFVVFGPGPQFVRDSLDVYDSKRSIGGDTRLLNLLPSRAGTQFSLLVYQDVAKAVPGLLGNTIMRAFSPAESKLAPNLGFMEHLSAPGIAYACAFPQYIDLFFSAPTGINANLGMAVPLVANWLMPHTSVGQKLERYADALVDLDKLKQAALAYQAQNGRLPATLEELARAGAPIIDQIPLDPFATAAGQTLRLAPGAQPGQIVLYSIGPDGVDDKGATRYDPDVDVEGPGDVIIKLPEDPAAANGGAPPASAPAPATAAPAAQ